MSVSLIAFLFALKEEGYFDVNFLEKFFRNLNDEPQHYTSHNTFMRIPLSKEIESKKEYRIYRLWRDISLASGDEG